MTGTPIRIGIIAHPGRGWAATAALTRRTTTAVGASGKVLSRSLERS